MSQSGTGRDHNMHGYTMWLAGGGVQPGRTIGETDDFGLYGVGDRYSIRDFHATLRHLPGLDQNKLWHLHDGRNENLTGFGSQVIGVSRDDPATHRAAKILPHTLPHSSANPAKIAA